MKYLILLTILLPVLSAHPMDDKAEMQLEVRVVSDSELELHFEFRYKDAVAVATELGSRLDLDEDGEFSDSEIRQRYLAHADETLLGLTINCADKQVFAEPVLDRFEFWDLDSAESRVNIYTARFGYKLIFTAIMEPAQPVKIIFSGSQSVVNIPARQLLAFDYRVDPVQKLTVEYSEELAVFPWMRFTAGPKETVPVSESKTNTRRTAEASQAKPEPEVSQPAWHVILLTIIFGSAGIFAMLQAIRRKRSNYVLYGILFWVVGLAIMFGSG